MSTIAHTTSVKQVKQLTPSTYLATIVGIVDSYKRARVEFEQYFANAHFLPDDSLEPFQDASMSDEENLKKKRQLYQWSTSADHFPPHINIIPPDESLPAPAIFDPVRLREAQAALGPGEVEFFHGLGPTNTLTMDTLEKRNAELHATAVEEKKDGVYAEENVGLRADWYTDAQFAQQHLTGVNPTALKRASTFWIGSFRTAAHAQKNAHAVHLLSSCDFDTLYVVDNSNFRSILGKAPDATIVSADGSISSEAPRYGCASVTLFALSPNGTLHPVAIIIDYRGSINAASSVTIFNRRLMPDAQCADEKTDWPWRYAKMCSHVADWTQHELAVHLVHTHLIEEGLIVAAQRNLPDCHIVLQILRPHWKKTLSLNALARQLLVPVYINDIVPIQLPDIQTFCVNAYKTFDFVGSYVPNDLERRGFPVSHLNDEKYHNYAYARDVAKSWQVLHKFVSDVLHGHYKNGDVDVRSDKYIASFCREMQAAEGGQLASFPTIDSLDSLIDAVTMCIHIAAPQHTAVNYLQQFYLSFIPNRPAALAAPIPRSLEELSAFTEAHVLASLPLTDQKDWLIMAEIPYLLSSEVDPENSIIAYAEQATQSTNPLIAEAGEGFRQALEELAGIIHKHSDEMDDQVTRYHVLDPEVMANSILI